jgi:hypothetical protein
MFRYLEALGNPIALEPHTIYTLSNCELRTFRADTWSAPLLNSTWEGKTMGRETD